MKQSTPENKAPASEARFSPFLPMLLLALCMLSLLSWNLYLVLNQRTDGQRLVAQLDLQLNQAARTEQKLQVIMSDLLELAKQDKQAAEIVTRYKIAFTPPAKPAK
jgi:hypothetical protein